MTQQKDGTGSGGNYIGQAIKKRLEQTMDGPDNLELATVTPKLGLQLDTYAHEIPKGEYLICRSLTLPSTLATNLAGQGTTWEHQHTTARPQQLDPIKAGDRVLVAWINGNDLIVLDVIISS